MKKISFIFLFVNYFTSNIINLLQKKCFEQVSKAYLSFNENNKIIFDVIELTTK